MTAPSTRSVKYSAANSPYGTILPRARRHTFLASESGTTPSRWSTSADSPTRGSMANCGSSRRRTTLTISTSWPASAMALAWLTTVRMVPPMPYACSSM